MSISKRKAKKKCSRLVLPVCVVGLSTGECDADGGVGKSSFCSRFVRPAFDDYEAVKGSLSSCLSEADFAHPVINNSHFLYYPPVSHSLHGHSSSDTAAEVTFHVVEQTIFTNDATFKPFIGSANYVQRATQRYLRSDGKLAFTCRDSIGADDSADTNANGFPSELFRRRTGVKGFVCIYDPTMTGERKRSQLTILCGLIKRIKRKVKVPVVLVVSKCDLLKTKQPEITCDVQEAMHLAKQFEIPLKFTSAHKNINVHETFVLVAKLVLGKKIKGVEQTTIDYEAAEEDHVQILHELEKEFGILLSSIVGSLQWTWSTLLPRLRGRDAFEKFVYMFGECQARSTFQRRVLQVVVAQCNKLWEGTDDPNDKTARARKQDILRDILDEHEDFYDVSDSQYESIDLLETPTHCRSNDYCSMSEARHQTLSGGTFQDTALVSFGTRPETSLANQLEESCSLSESEEWPCSDDEVIYEEIPGNSCCVPEPEEWPCSDDEVIYEEIPGNSCCVPEPEEWPCSDDKIVYEVETNNSPLYMPMDYQETTTGVCN